MMNCNWFQCNNLRGWHGWCKQVDGRTFYIWLDDLSLYLGDDVRQKAELVYNIHLAEDTTEAKMLYRVLDFIVENIGWSSVEGGYLMRPSLLHSFTIFDNPVGVQQQIPPGARWSNDYVLR